MIDGFMDEEDPKEALMEELLKRYAVRGWSPESEVEFTPKVETVKCGTCNGASVLASGVGLHPLAFGDSSIQFVQDTVPPTIAAIAEDSPLAGSVNVGDIILRVSYWIRDDPESDADEPLLARMAPDAPKTGSPAFDCSALRGSALQTLLLSTEAQHELEERVLTVRSVKIVSRFWKPVGCFVCAGTGSVSKHLSLYTSPEDDQGTDEYQCEICYGPSRFGVSPDCMHFYCEGCISGALDAILEAGQFPAYCPACRLESAEDGHTEPSHGRIEEPALTFLQQHGVIDLDFQFRFMRQQDRGEHFFECPAKCGRYLIDQDPQFSMVPRGFTENEGFDRKMRLGKCECGARVCVQCHGQATEEMVGSQLTWVHQCPEDLDRGTPTDPATLQLMSRVGKRCPNCNAFIQKSDGCNGNAHSSPSQLRETSNKKLLRFQ
eukprot:COSAG04_NODE_2617_length_3848_cov_2.473460_2_plen_434_part_00